MEPRSATTKTRTWAISSKNQQAISPIDAATMEGLAEATQNMLAGLTPREARCCACASASI